MYSGRYAGIIPCHVGGRNGREELAFIASQKVQDGTSEGGAKLPVSGDGEAVLHGAIRQERTGEWIL